MVTVIQSYSVLVVDDDQDIVESLSIYLRHEGYEVLKAYDGLQALEIINTKPVHLLLMDIMMPKLDGIKATLKIREEKNIPIIIVSAKSEDMDKIHGLTVGADDYVTKPFNPLELLARVKSQLRRYTSLGNMDQSHTASKIIISGLQVDPECKSVAVDGEFVKLTPLEYGILELLCKHPNRVFSAEEIYRRVWNGEGFVNDNTIAVHVRRIREKIEINPKEPKYLKVVWGVGYRIEKN
ncbi:response regulator transcription factor [Heliobacterium mobile]|uniref:response regulator transcription factor n=1 Tax=Heliobacterium mobile TaxID=28064 RepID=UPI002E252723